MYKKSEPTQANKLIERGHNSDQEKNMKRNPRPGQATEPTTKNKSHAYDLPTAQKNKPKNTRDHRHQARAR